MLSWRNSCGSKVRAGSREDGRDEFLGAGILRPLQQRFGTGALQDLHRSLDDVLEGGHMREQIEPLEHHPGRKTLPCCLVVGQLVKLVADAAVADERPIHPEGAAAYLLQLIDASEERAL